MWAVYCGYHTMAYNDDILIESHTEHSARWGSVELAVLRQIHTIYNRMFFSMICKYVNILEWMISAVL